MLIHNEGGSAIDCRLVSDTNSNVQSVQEANGVWTREKNKVRCESPATRSVAQSVELRDAIRVHGPPRLAGVVGGCSSPNQQGGGELQNGRK